MAASFLILLLLIPLWLIGCDDSAAGLDLSTPRVAVGSFYEKLRAGDSQVTRQAVVQDGVQPRLAAQLAETVAAGLAAGDLTTLPKVNAARLEAADVSIDDDTARVELPPEAEEKVERRDVVVLKRDDDVWRVDLLATTGMSVEQAKNYVARLDAAEAALRSDVTE